MVVIFSDNSENIKYLIQTIKEHCGAVEECVQILPFLKAAEAKTQVNTIIDISLLPEERILEIAACRATEQAVFYSNSPTVELACLLMENNVTRFLIDPERQLPIFFRPADTQKGLPGIKRYIDSHFTEYVTLDLLSKEFAICPSLISTKFKELHGQTITKYICFLRIDLAKKLLRASDKKIYEIAQICGFSSSKYFISVFRKAAGMTPEQFRKISASD